jgi:dimethylhistidine N-methyltransferase
MDKRSAKSKFGSDIIEGFLKSPKTINSKYFYDKEGDRLFQKIMELPEYYLTNCEREIFETQKEQIFRQICPKGRPFNLIELGAGDASKTIILLHYFLQKGVDFTYFPVDISAHILKELEHNLKMEMPGLDVQPLHMDYFEALSNMGRFSNRKNITMFLGSNVGNFENHRLLEFLMGIKSHFKTFDKLFLGIDLKKHPEVILAAYNDQQGITAQFNYNLLTRMNRELGANFDTEKFIHYPMYDPVTGEAKSFLVSQEQQQIHFSDLDFSVELDKGECIHTEISRKYSLPDIEKLAKSSGFEIERNFFDSRNYYVNTMWEAR